jgi:hypothetical protein
MSVLWADVLIVSLILFCRVTINRQEREGAQRNHKDDLTPHRNIVGRALPWPIQRSSAPEASATFRNRGREHRLNAEIKPSKSRLSRVGKVQGIRPISCASIFNIWCSIMAFNVIYSLAGRILPSSSPDEKD